MGSISPVSNALCYFLERDYLNSHNGKTEKLDIVVVLGGGVSDNKYLGRTLPSYQTTSRLLYAVQAFRDSGAEYLVCAGKGGGKISEAEVMAKAAEGIGVPAARIKLDSISKNTGACPEPEYHVSGQKYQYRTCDIGISHEEKRAGI